MLNSRYYGRKKLDLALLDMEYQKEGFIVVHGLESLM